MCALGMLEIDSFDLYEVLAELINKVFLCLLTRVVALCAGGR